MPASPPSIKNATDFQEIFAKGQKVFGEKISLFFLNYSELKIGMAISKKQGNAVQRNRARRLIKEFFRLNQEKIKKAKIVIVARKPLLETYNETAKIMLKLLRQAGLIKRRSRPEE